MWTASTTFDARTARERERRQGQAKPGRVSKKVSFLRGMGSVLDICPAARETWQPSDTFRSILHVLGSYFGVAIQRGSKDPELAPYFDQYHRFAAESEREASERIIMLRQAVREWVAREVDAQLSEYTQRAGTREKHDRRGGSKISQT